MIKKILSDRINLLRYGIRPPLLNGKPLKHFSPTGVGAGPQGRTFTIRYQEYPDYKSMISLPIYPHQSILHDYAYQTHLNADDDSLTLDNGIILASRRLPKFINKTLSDGVPYIKRGVGMLHAFNTFSISMSYGCRHFDAQNECKYCEIVPVGKTLLGFSEIPVIKNIVEGVKLAVETEQIRTITLTSGSFNTSDNIVPHFIALIKEIRKITDIPIHVQFEPVSDTSLLKELSYHADSVGIFLEILDEKIRRKICPGKSQIPRERYFENWLEAVKYFKKGNVVTTCLLGFGENLDDILQTIAGIAELGVMVAIIFTRFKSKALKDSLPSYLAIPDNVLTDFYINAAEILHDNGLPFKRFNTAGCIGCQGCTAMVEASEYLESL